MNWPMYFPEHNQQHIPKTTSKNIICRENYSPKHLKYFKRKVQKKSQ